MSMLEVDHVSKRYDGAQGVVIALDDVSLTAGPGDFVAIQGPSGCGKTTLLLTVGGLLRASSGRVSIAGQDLYALSSARRAQVRASLIGFVFQQFHLVPYCSVLDNVLAPALALPSPTAHDRARELIAEFGLSERIDHVPAKLSTGERQRVALARALMNRPKLLLADEPTGNLDHDNALIVLNHIARFASDGGTVLLVTHDGEAAQAAHRVLPLQNGRVLPVDDTCSIHHRGS